MEGPRAWFDVNTPASTPCPFLRPSGWHWLTEHAHLALAGTSSVLHLVSSRHGTTYMQYGVILRRIHSVWPPCFLLASFIPPPSHSSSSCAFCVATSPFAGQLCRNCLSCASPPSSILWIAAFIHSLFFLFASNLLYIFVSPGRTDAVAQTRLKHSAPPSSVYQVRIVCSCAGNVPEIATCSIKMAAALMAASRHTAEARPNPRAHCLLTFPSVSYFFHCCIDSCCWGFDLQTHSCSD